MLRGLYSAASGMQAQRMQQEVLADNLANTNTIGFKSSKNTFKVYGERIINRYSSADSERGITMGTLNDGTSVHSTMFNFEQGSLRVTNNPLDIAVNGKGFIPVRGDGDKIYYTRNGNFTLNSTGHLATQDGREVLDSSLSNIYIGQGEEIKDVKILNNGDFIINGELATKLNAYDFPSTTGILKLAKGYYTQAQATDSMARSNSSFQQGFLETSNVSSIRASTDLIQIQRTYEANKKVIETEVDTLQMLMNVGRI